MDLKKICQLIEQEMALTPDPKIALKEMLQLYSYLYQKLGGLAVRYGNGTHPKHRVTKYHDFFVKHVLDNESVLDLGSGRGDVTYDVSKKTSGKVVGVELNPNNVHYAKKTYQNPNLTFVKGDLCTDVKDEHFDVVIMSNVLEHLDNRVELLKTVTAKATPKRILFRVPQFEREWTVPLKKELGLGYFLDSTHKIEYTYDEFINEMAAAGLTIWTHETRINWGEIWAVCYSNEVSRGE